MTTTLFARTTAFVLATSLCLPAAAGYRGSSNTVRAKVLSADPIVEAYEVEMPREVCRQEQVRELSRGAVDDRYYASRQATGRSRTPGIVGAIIGGAIGHSVGNGKTNKKIGTAVGAVLGGSIGADISRRNQERRVYADARGPELRYEPVRYRTERVCEVVVDYRTEERVSGYDVSYAYGGQTYATILDYDPGKYLDVAVSVTPVNR